MVKLTIENEGRGEHHEVTAVGCIAINPEEDSVHSIFEGYASDAEIIVMATEFLRVAAQNFHDDKELQVGFLNAVCNLAKRELEVME